MSMGLPRTWEMHLRIVGQPERGGTAMFTGQVPASLSYSFRVCRFSTGAFLRDCRWDCREHVKCTWEKSVNPSEVSSCYISDVTYIYNRAFRT